MQVTYKRHWGNDLDVVNNARVSFGKESELICTDLKVGTYELSLLDQSLLKFLARGCTSGDWDKLIDEFDVRADLRRRDLTRDLMNHVKKMPSHWVPFANGIGATMHFKVPMFVAAQLKKHQVGFTVSEISRRYVSDTPEFYVPDVWRKAPEGSVKQGSSDEGVDVAYYDRDDGYNDWPTESNSIALEAYQEMLKLGVCPEMARMVLPQSLYTEIIMSGSLFGWANVYNQRIDPHAQKEIQGVAKQIKDIMEPLFPYSWKELTQ